MERPASGRHTTLASIFVGALSATLLLARLMIPRPVGVADSYDGARLMCHLNVIARSPQGTAPLRDYVVWRYDHSSRASCAQHFIGSIELPSVPYRSSQVLILHAGRWLTRLLGLPGALDLRAVGTICCLLIGGALGLLFWALTFRPRYRLALCGLLLVVVADASFIDYAISPFSEIAAIIGLLYVIPGVVLLVQPRGRGVAGLTIVTAAGVFLVTAKTQDAIIAVPLAILVVTVKSPIGGRRLLSAGAALALVASAVLLADHGDAHSRQLVKANFVTATLLRIGTDPAADLQELGASSRLAVVRGEPVWCAPPAELKSSDYSRFLTEASYARIGTFLAHHPGRIPAVLSTTAEAFDQPRPAATLCSGHTGRTSIVPLASYGRVPDTAPGSVEHRFTPVTSTLRLLRGTGFLPLAALWAASLGVALATLARRRPDIARDQLSATAVTVLLTAIAVIQFAVSAFGDGIDTSKHLNLSVFATAAAWVFALATLTLTVSRRRPIPRSGERDSGVPTTRGDVPPHAAGPA